MRRNDLLGLEYLQYGGGGGSMSATNKAPGGATAPGSAGKTGSTSKEDTPDVIQGEGNKFWVAKVQDNQTGDKLYALKDGVSKDGDKKADGPKSEPPEKAPTAKKSSGPAKGGKSGG